MEILIYFDNTTHFFMLWVFFYFLNNLLYICYITILAGQFFDRYENNGPRVNKIKSIAFVCDCLSWTMRYKFDLEIHND